MKDNYRIVLNALRLQRFENSETDGNVRIEGYACHYRTANHNGELVDENSFRKFFEQLKDGGLMPIFNYQHDDMRIIGGWDLFESREDGLWAEGHLNTKCAFVRDEVLPLVQSGDVSHLSTQGYCKWSDIDEMEDGSLFIKDFILTGVSLVALPADFNAVANLKNALQAEKARISSKNSKLIY